MVAIERCPPAVEREPTSVGDFFPEKFLSSRARSVDASGIRKVFDLGARLENPINLSIGQPDYDVPESVRQAAVEAIQSGKNG